MATHMTYSPQIRAGRREWAGLAVLALPTLLLSLDMSVLYLALLGVAGATLMPSTLALISTMFRDQHQRGVAIAVWMTCFMGGMTVGPLVGGVLLEAFWWGSAFLLGVPVMLLLLVTAPILLPEHRDPSAGRLDMSSVALSLATILPVVYGLKELAHDGWRAQAVTTVLGGVAFGVVFIRRQLRLDDPLIDPALFGSRMFSTGLGLNLGGGVVMAGTFLLLSQFLQLVEGMTPLGAGLSLVPLNVAMAISSILAPQIARRHHPGLAMAIGFAVAASGMVVAVADGVVPMLAGFALACIGIAVPSALAINLIVGSAPPEKAGAASGISETSGELGIALGVAVVGSVGAAVYRDQVDVPAQVPAEAASAAGESLAGAVGVADRLPAEVAGLLLGPAKEAFTSGLHVAAVMGAVAFAALALVAGMVFRTLRPYGENGQSETLEPSAELADGCLVEA